MRLFQTLIAANVNTEGEGTVRPSTSRYNAMPDVPVPRQTLWSWKKKAEG